MIAIAPEEERRIRLAEAQGLVDDRLQHRAHVVARVGDGPQHRRARRLPLEPFLCLVEETDVLDRDRALSGECLDECDLPIVERPHGAPRKEDHADRAIFFEHRYDQHGVRLIAERAVRVFGIRRDVCYVDGSALRECSRYDRTTARHTWCVADRLGDLLRHAAILRLTWRLCSPGSCNTCRHVGQLLALRLRWCRQ